MDTNPKLSGFGEWGRDWVRYGTSFTDPGQYGGMAYFLHFTTTEVVHAPNSTWRRQIFALRCLSTAVEGEESGVMI